MCLLSTGDFKDFKYDGIFPLPMHTVHPSIQCVYMTFPVV